MLLYLGLTVVLVLAEIFVGVTLLLCKDWALRVIQTGIIHTDDPAQATTPAMLTTSAPVQTPHSALHPVVADALERLGGAAGWVVIGSTGLSLCVMLWDWTHARSIVQSQSIPRAFLSVSAFQLWGVKSYTHFCFLSKIRWGRNLRQRFVTMVYFGLQGTISYFVFPNPYLLIHPPFHSSVLSSAHACSRK